MREKHRLAAIPSGVPVKLRLYAAGYCRNPEFLTLRGGRLMPVKFPAGFACIFHPQHGPILFDTGYSARFFEETKRFPASLYRRVTPVTFRDEDSAIRQLERCGIAAEDVRYVVLSHFHGDHIAGARDFPQAQFLYKREAYDAVKHLGPFASVRAGFLPGLLPDNLAERSLYIEEVPKRELPRDFPFPTGYDVFGDGSLIAVDVPGHATGQIGLFLTTACGEYFLCADAAWSSRAIRERRKPSAAAGLIMADRRSYDDTFERLCRLHEQHPSIQIIPSHCQEALERHAEVEGR